jgi:hypothetical protein
MNVENGAEAALFPEKESIRRIFVAVWDQANRGKNLLCFREIERKLTKLSMPTFTYRSSS